jgi:hypothetical protein
MADARRLTWSGPAVTFFGPDRLECVGTLVLCAEGRTRTVSLEGLEFRLVDTIEPSLVVIFEYESKIDEQLVVRVHVVSGMGALLVSVDARGAEVVSASDFQALHYGTALVDRQLG